VLELVKWSFILPFAAVLCGLTARGVACIFHSFFEITFGGFSTDRAEEMFTSHAHAEIARLRPRSNVH
jgi:hypothetical protein